MTRIAHDLIQVIYAFNEIYFFSVKKTYGDIPKFQRLPNNFFIRIEQTLGNIGTTNIKLQESLQVFGDLIENCKLLTKDIYVPKYE